MGAEPACDDAGDSCPEEEPNFELLTALDAAIAGERLDAIAV
jgi:hypothetical protein